MATTRAMDSSRPRRALPSKGPLACVRTGVVVVIDSIITDDRPRNVTISVTGGGWITKTRRPLDRENAKTAGSRKREDRWITKTRRPLDHENAKTHEVAKREGREARRSRSAKVAKREGREVSNLRASCPSYCFAPSRSPSYCFAPSRSPSHLRDPTPPTRSSPTRPARDPACAIPAPAASRPARPRCAARPGPESR